MKPGDDLDQKIPQKKSNEKKNNTDSTDQKRRSSLTGSLLDTSSSSSCSVNADEGDPLDQVLASKATMTTTLGAPLLISSTLNKGAVPFDNIESDVNKSNGEGKKSNYGSVGERENGTAAKSVESRRTTKKQSRREKRKKEKRNGESWQVQDITAENQLEKSPVVQELLNLRIAEKQQNVQKRIAARHQIPVSFGDFSGDRGASSLRVRTLPSSNSFSRLSSEGAPENAVNGGERENFVQVFSTGSRIHNLFRCEEMRGSSARFHVAIDNNESKGAQSGTTNGGNSCGATAGATNEDGMEVENLMKMIDDSNKLAQKYSHWMRSFHDSIVDGDPLVFTNKFNCIMRILKKSACGERYSRMTEREFKEHVMIGVVHQFYNQQERTTVLHQLAATRNAGEPCSTRNHGSCTMIRLILGTLSWRDMCSLLRVRTRQTGKTAMHMAATTGQSCQLEALMAFDMCPNTLDRSGRAPIHYSVMKNDVCLVKMLLWYGADISLMERQCTPLQLASLNPSTAEVGTFLDLRLEALKKQFMEWVCKFVGGVWSPYRAITDLHFVKVSRDGDSRLDATPSVESGSRSCALNVRTNVMQLSEFKKYPLSLLFIIPTFYTREDQYRDASCPQIFRAAMTSDRTGDIVKLIPTRPLLKGGSISPAPLEAAFTNPHNGYFYVYQLPRHLPTGTYSLHFSVATDELRRKAPHLSLAVQGIACGPPEVRLWRPIHEATLKSKID